MERRMNKDGWGWKDSKRKENLIGKDTTEERSRRVNKIRCQPTDIDRQELGRQRSSRKPSYQPAMRFNVEQPINRQVIIQLTHHKWSWSSRQAWPFAVPVSSNKDRHNKTTLKRSDSIL
jgi:hypothetical protein